MYIGAMAGTIYSLQSPQQAPSLNGKLVGGMKHHIQDAIIVAQHGGIMHDITVDDDVEGVMELMKQLKEGTVQGLVVNRLTYQRFYQAITLKGGRYEYMAQTVKDIHMVRHELEYRGEKVVSGMLVKRRDDYEFFRRYFDNNWLHIEACNSFDLNYKDVRIESTEPSHFEGLFYPFFYGTVIILGIILIFGFVYEFHRRKGGEHMYRVRDKVQWCGTYHQGKILD